MNHRNSRGRIAFIHNIDNKWVFMSERSFILKTFFLIWIANIMDMLNIVVKSHSNTESRSNVIWNMTENVKAFSRWWHVVIIWANRMSRRTTFASSDLELEEDNYKCATGTFFFLGKSKKHLYRILVFAFKVI